MTKIRKTFEVKYC